MRGRFGASRVAGSYLVGGAVKHCAGLLSQGGLRVALQWVHSEDLKLLSAPEKPKAKAGMGLGLGAGWTVARLSSRPEMGREKEKEKEKEKGEEKEEKSEEEREREGRFFYEEKFPELIAMMLQTKVVKMGQKQGFEFIEYFNERGSRKVKAN